MLHAHILCQPERKFRDSQGEILDIQDNEQFNNNNNNNNMEELSNKEPVK